jgi:heme exporter protein A
MFWARLYPGSKPDSIDTALGHFGIAKAADLPARFLSAGQRRRLSLARLGVVPATIWLLDEPATALDADGTAALEAAIEAHCQVDGIVVAATHTALAMPRAADLDLAGV